jgi:2-amino-4-hydroxy-6-hydroxymethyldihydropteridine diphosphokinase
MAHIAYIGIGSNLGDKVRQCEKAIFELLKIDGHVLLAQSSFYKTKPIGFTRQDWFINSVIKIKTDLEPKELLRELKEVEAQLGRRTTFRWGPRTIDLDILLFDNAEVRTEELQIPHPSMQERQFVLLPLIEIDPDLVHPVLKKTVKTLSEEIEEDQGVVKLDSLPESHPALL